MGKLGMGQRVQLYAALTRHTIDTAGASGYELVVATDRPGSLFTRSGVRHVLHQRGNGFGTRLENAVRDTLALGYDRVAVIGNDSPELNSSMLQSALGQHTTGDLGLCRAADGGVSLITLDRQTLAELPELFSAPRWETGFVHDDLACIARGHGRPVLSLGQSRDIDSSADLVQVALSAEAPFMLRVFAGILQAGNAGQRFPRHSFIPSSRLILRTCRQKAPPLS